MHNHFNARGIQSTFSEGDVFWDIGANVGAYSLIAARVTKATVLAFEPSAQTFSLLVKNVELNNGYIIAELDDDVRDFTPIAQLLIANKFRIHEIKQEEVNLETAFMALTEGVTA